MTVSLMVDAYKISHARMYHKDTKYVYSNFTPRSSRTGFPGVIFFGLQPFIQDILVDGFNEEFFSRPKQEVLKEYALVMKHYLGSDFNTDHLGQLHDLGYLPLEIRALEEGKLCPIGVPCLTIINTDPRFFWLTNYIETMLSASVWHPTTTATTAFQYLINFHRFSKETCDSLDFIPYQGHDFSMRGQTSCFSAMMSGMGHLTCFDGTDTVPAVLACAQFYKNIFGCSVAASEHAVATTSILLHEDQEQGEEDFIRRMILEEFPTGIISLVSDSFDYWRVITDILPRVKDEICGRDGKLVIRPDSGDPVRIVCGYTLDEVIHIEGEYVVKETGQQITKEEFDGSIQCLWNTFGGKINSKGFKELDSHIGLIYGDSITLERQYEILSRLKNKGFAANNIVLGIGSYTYQYVTRDTYGFAMKVTKAKIGDEWKDVYKDPKTDSGKKSLRGWIKVVEDNGLKALDQQPDNGGGYLLPVFKNGKLLRKFTMSEVRSNVKKELEKFV